MVVAEDAVRARARVPRRLPQPVAPHRGGVRVEKHSACTAIQRLMSQEGLLLDVAGGERSSPRWPRAPTRPECCCTVTPKPTRELGLAVGSGIGLVVVDNFDDIDRLERIVEPGSRRHVWCG